MVFYAKAIALTSLLINIAQYGPEFHTTAFQYPREWRVGEIYSDPICDRCLWAALSLPAQANCDVAAQFRAAGSSVAIGVSPGLAVPRQDGGKV